MFSSNRAMVPNTIFAGANSSLATCPALAAPRAVSSHRGDSSAFGVVLCAFVDELFDFRVLNHVDSRRKEPRGAVGTPDGVSDLGVDIVGSGVRMREWKEEERA